MKIGKGLAVGVALCVLVACGGGKPPLDPSAVPAGSGWSCTRPASDTTVVGCQRTPAECEALQAEAGHPGPCFPRETAYCASYKKEGATKLSCGNQGTCEALAELKRGRGYADVSACTPLN